MKTLVVSTKERKNLELTVLKIKEKFLKNKTAMQVVAPQFDFIEVKEETHLVIGLNMVFPSFLIPANYSLIIGVIVFILTGFKIPILISSGIIWLILMLPDFLQHPRILYYFFLRGIQKNGFNGKVKYEGGK